MTWTRRYLDVDGIYDGFYDLAVFNNQLCIFNRINATDARMLYSTDGTLWSTLFDALGVNHGNFSGEDAKNLIVYNNSLFLSLYRSNNTDPKVLEYDGVALTNHLPNPSSNYGVFRLYVWANRLWALSDVTPAVNDRRVIYYYNGIVWTAITNYDGATYLDYNCADAVAPTIAIRHITNHFIEHDGDLYFICARKGAASRWAWEVWKFNSAIGDRFTKVYDSDDLLLDNMVPFAVVEHGGNIWLFAGELYTNGNPLEILRVYKSADGLASWTIESDLNLFLDEFDDATRDPAWTDEPNNGTIVEAAGLLTMSVANLVNGDFWGATKNAPITTMTPGENEVSVIAKLNNYTVNVNSRAGIYITDAVSGNNGVHFGRVRSGTQNGLAVINMGVGDLAYTAVTTLPIWLRVRISGSGAGSVMKFDYSTDGITWTTLHTQSNESWSLAGLVAMNWATFPAIAAPFEFFHVYLAPGAVWGIEEYGNTIYLNTHEELRAYDNIYFWDDSLAMPNKLEMITSNPILLRGGGMKVF